MTDPDFRIRNVSWTLSASSARNVGEFRLTMDPTKVGISNFREFDVASPRLSHVAEGFAENIVSEFDPEKDWTASS